LTTSAATAEDIAFDLYPGTCAFQFCPPDHMFDWNTCGCQLDTTLFTCTMQACGANMQWDATLCACTSVGITDPTNPDIFGTCNITACASGSYFDPSTCSCLLLDTTFDMTYELEQLPSCIATCNVNFDTQNVSGWGTCSYLGGPAGDQFSAYGEVIGSKTLNLGSCSLSCSCSAAGGCVNDRAYLDSLVVNASASLGVVYVNCTADMCWGNPELDITFGLDLSGLDIPAGCSVYWDGSTVTGQIISLPTPNWPFSAYLQCNASDTFNYGAGVSCTPFTW
jgi:hypothetical protein